MGYRTVVILYNDLASKWENDPLLGKRIARASHYALESVKDSKAQMENFGHVAQVVHNSQQTLALIAGYSLECLAQTYWNERQESIKLKLLKDAADKLGYRLSKKPVKENNGKTKAPDS